MKKLNPQSTKYRGKEIQYVLLQDIPETYRNWIQVYMINKLPYVSQEKSNRDYLYRWFWVNTTAPTLDGGQKTVKKEGIFYETYDEWYQLAIAEINSMGGRPA